MADEANQLNTMEGEESKDLDEQLKKLSIAEGKKIENAEGEPPMKIMLETEDGVTFEVEPWIVKEMKAVELCMDVRAHPSVVIPLCNVRSSELHQIIRYCEVHCRDEAGELKEFDNEFVEALSSDELKKLLLAANYLNMKNLLELVSKRIAAVIQNKSLDSLRNFFGFESDYTYEEEELFREEKDWAFEDVDSD